MDFSEAKLIELNQRGIIPGPQETPSQFKQRVEKIENIKKTGFQKINFVSTDHPLSWHDWDWARCTLCELFDTSPDWIQGYYCNKGLKFWQGAATYISLGKTPLPTLQIRKYLRKGRYFGIYDRDEILSHEAVHAIRMAFSEPKTEELFAYWTATSSFRKIFGPLFQKEWESNFLMFLVLLGLGGQIIFSFFFFPIYLTIFKIFSFLSLAFLSFALFRLFFLRSKVNKTLKKLVFLLKSKEKARAVMFRLSDKEIFWFAKASIQKIQGYIQKAFEKELRWKVIKLAYFKR